VCDLAEGRSAVTTNELVVTLDARGVRLRAKGDGKLRYCPRDAVSEELLRELAVNKEEILTLYARGKVEVITCPSDDCDERIVLVNGQGYCNRNNMAINDLRKVEVGDGPRTVYVREYKTQTSVRRAARAVQENREPNTYRCLHCEKDKTRDEMSQLSTGDISHCCTQCWEEFLAGQPTIAAQARRNEELRNHEEKLRKQE
jgi:hypothetical protein